MAASVSHFFFGPEAPLFSAALFALAMPGPCEWWGRVYAAYIRVGGEGYPLCLFYFGGAPILVLCALCVCTWFQGQFMYIVGYFYLFYFLLLCIARRGSFCRGARPGARVWVIFV